LITLLDLPPVGPMPQTRSGSMGGCAPWHEIRARLDHTTYAAVRDEEEKTRQAVISQLGL
jgi:hypothetical protein